MKVIIKLTQLDKKNDVLKALLKSIQRANRLQQQVVTNGRTIEELLCMSTKNIGKPF